MLMGAMLFFWISAAFMVGGILFFLMPLVGGHKRFAVGFALCLPLVAVGVYSLIGSPHMRDMPFAQRIAAQPETLPAEAVLVLLEEAIRKNPQDIQGWRLLARAQQSMGDFIKASDSWRALIARDDNDAEALGNLAQCLIEREEGLISDEAFDLLERAFTLDATDNATRYFLGLAYAQQQDTKNAISIWRALLAELAADHPLAQELKQRLAALE